jgi:hypothetical protein
MSALSAVQVRDQSQREAFEAVWREVWALEGYDEGRPEEMLAEYRQYDHVSMDFLFLHRGEAIGTMRLVVQQLIKDGNEQLELPTIKDFDVRRDPDIDVEITLLTLLKEHRHAGNFLVMMDLMVARCRELGFRKGVIAGHPRLVAMYRQLGMISWEGEGKYYQGSITIPAILTLENVERGISALKR